MQKESWTGSAGLPARRRGSLGLASHHGPARSWARKLLLSGTSACLLRDNQPLLCSLSSGLPKYPGVRPRTPLLGARCPTLASPMPFHLPALFPGADPIDPLLGMVGFQEILMEWILNFFSGTLPCRPLPLELSQEPAWSGSDFWSVSTPSMGPGYPSSSPQS